MTSLILPRRFTSQPPGFARLDYGHPLAKSLELGSLPTGTVRVACPHGVAGSISLSTPDTAMGDRLRKATVLAGLYRHANIAVDNQIFATVGNIGWSWFSNIEYLFHATNSGSDPTAQKTIFSHNNDTQASLGYGTLSAGQHVHWVYQYDASVASPWANTLYGTTTHRNHTPVGTFPWNTGQRRSVSFGNATVGFYATYALWFSRILSAGEIAEIQRNPWQLFRVAE